MSIADKITRLTTARDGIRTALAGKGVSAGSHGFEDFASDIGSIQTGITPSGTKTITANGTYDVADFANADVNVPTGATNCKRWTVTLASDVTSATNVVTSDPDVAAHFADANAVAVITRQGVPESGRFNAINKNTYFYNTSYGYIGHASGAVSGSYPISSTRRDVSMAIYADGSGNIGITADGTSASRTWAAGTYDLLFWW